MSIQLPRLKVLRSCRVGIVLSVMIMLGFVLLPSAGNAQRNPGARDPQNQRMKEFNNPGPEQIAAAEKALSSQSRTVLDRLSSLSELSVQGWRYHVGDVDNAQAVSFDDSSWPMIQLPSRTGTTERHLAAQEGCGSQFGWRL